MDFPTDLMAKSPSHWYTLSPSGAPAATQRILRRMRPARQAKRRRLHGAWPGALDETE